MPSNAEVRISKEVITKAYAEVILNGQSKGKREINGKPGLREFCEGLAEEFGVKTFTVTLDKVPVTSAAQAEAPVAAGSRVELHTKDTRGAKKGNQPPAANAGTQPTPPADSTVVPIDKIGMAAQATTETEQAPAGESEKAAEQTTEQAAGEPNNASDSTEVKA